MTPIKKTRILFFIGSLVSGGKERRLIELLTYLKEQGSYDLMMVVTKDEVHYPAFFKLEIPYQVIRKQRKKNDLSVFYQFYKICKKFQPNLIHTWGSMQSFYTLPAVIGQGVPLVNSQITAAPPHINKWSVVNLIDRINFRFSKVILSNSKAGIDAYNPPVGKGKVIYNGLNTERFVNLPPIDEMRSKYGIKTPYSVVMSASFTANKDYRFFYQVADAVTKRRKDITFIGVGRADKTSGLYDEIKSLSKGNDLMIFPGRINDVEALVNACTVGMLFSNKSVHGEGISNSVLEYMALGKPVIANDAGGTREIVHSNENGYLIADQTPEQVADLLTGLIDDKEKYRLYGARSKQIIDELFSLQEMGKAFERVYGEVLNPERAVPGMQVTPSL